MENLLDYFLWFLSKCLAEIKEIIILFQSIHKTEQVNQNDCSRTRIKETKQLHVQHIYCRLH